MRDAARNWATPENPDNIHTKNQSTNRQKEIHAGGEMSFRSLTTLLKSLKGREATAPIFSGQRLSYKKEASVYIITTES